MSAQPDGNTAHTAATPSGPAPRAVLQSLVIGGEARITASISMLYTDILSQEINSQLSTPDSVSLLQKHLQNKSLEQLSQNELAPLLESIPDSLLDLAREAAFSSGALLKRAADKEDCAEMVVAMCRTGTMTGQTVVIDAGRVFH